MLRKYQYTFLNKTCNFCQTDLVEDFWTESTQSMRIERSGAFCPNAACKYNRMVIHWRATYETREFLENVSHILFSEEKTVTRLVQEQELIKKHGVEASWLTIGKKLYRDFIYTREDSIKEFTRDYGKDTHTLVYLPKLVYLPNSHLQRLYFFIPGDAIT